MSVARVEPLEGYVNLVRRGLDELRTWIADEGSVSLRTAGRGFRIVRMLDSHCHLDLYPDPSQTAMDADNAGVFTVFVTNLPSAFAWSAQILIQERF